MKRLVLFDIDETLISSDGAGRRAIGQAIARMFNVDISKISVNLSGKTDPQILHEILKASSFTEAEVEEKMAEILEIYISLLQNQIDQSKKYIIHNGIPEILTKLENTENTFLGLLTGNIERGARMKLEKCKLNNYFPIGAYGSDSANRMELPKIATDRGSKHYELEFSPQEVTIIGDSIYDVMCAKGFGAKSLAVNTGSTKRDLLVEQEPDYLFEDMSDIDAVMQAIFE